VLTDPRAVARVRLTPSLVAILGSGFFHQLPNALLMVAGFALPPQRAWQNSLGVEATLPAQFDARVTGYCNWLYDLPSQGGIVPGIDSALGGDVSFGRRDAFEGRGRAYGVEFFLRRKLERGLYGWITYTLSRSERWNGGGPVTLFDYDQTHVLNLALSWRLNERWRLGARFQFATGTPAAHYQGGIFDTDERSYSPYVVAGVVDRNPLSHQLDLRADYFFTAGPMRMNAFLDVINAYNAQNGDLGWQYRFDYAERRPLGGLPILPTIGLRGEL
jgi:outer membrane receptor for ferrienterochelin and colicin